MGNGYIYIIAAASSVALGSFVSYDSERMKASRFALGIILLASLVLPLISTVKGLSNMDFEIYESDEYTSDFLEKTLESSFEEGIARAIEEEFGIDTSNISVDCTGFDSEKLSADKVYVKLSGKAAFSDVPSIRNYVEKNGFGNCEVEVHFE